MARIKFGAIVTEGSGSLGGHTLQHSVGGNQIRTKPLPNTSPTSPQYLIRRKIPCLQYSWKALSDIQKTVWDRYAVDHDIRAKKGDHQILSGHSLWMKYQYYNWTEECNLPVDPETASLLYPTFADYVPPPFQPPIVPVFPPHVNPPAKPTISISGNLSLCEGQTVSLISSYGDFYLWSTGATGHTITVNTPGSYTVKVGNVGNLWSVNSDPTVVTVGSAPSAPVITVTDYLPGPVDDPHYILLIGEGSFATLTSEVAESYIWSTGEITRSIQVSQTGFYTVRVYNAQGCISPVSERITVQSYNRPPQPDITPSGPLTFCEGGSVNLECSLADSYLWSTDETTRTITVSAAGSYTVIIENSSGYESLPSDPAVVTVNPLPNQPTITPDGPTEFCDGDSVDLESSLADSYLWYKDAISTGLTTRTITASVSGSYTVKVMNSSNCQSVASFATIVTVNELPAQPTITPDGPTEFCDGDSVDLESSIATSYLWYKNAISTGLSTRTITASLAGSYTVKVTNANGCQSVASAATVVTISEAPDQPTITPDGPTEFCDGGSVDLQSSIATSYLWYKDTISTGLTTRTITASDAGSYTVKVTNAGGCQSIASAATVVTVNELPAQPTITPDGPTEFCQGDSVDLESSVSTSYLWYKSGISTGITTRIFTATHPDSYTVKVTNSEGCQSIASEAVVVTVNDLPDQPTITPDGPTEFCDGDSVDLESSVATSYLWYKDAVSTDLTTRTITASDAGSYTVKVTNADGCQSIASAATVVTVNEPPAKPTITPSGPLDIPSGGSVDLQSSVGTTYLWSTTETTRTITVTASGSYTVQVYDANGCISPASDPAVVTEYDRGFKTRWVVSGDFTARTITLPLKANRSEGALTYDFIVNWGDGSTGHVTSWNHALKTHTYINNGTYDVEIWGTCEGWSFDNAGTRSKITHILDFGVSTGFNGFKYLKAGFKGCVNLVSICAGGFLASGTGCLTDGFEETFSMCYNLSSVPENLFRYHPNVTTNAFRSTFSQAGLLETIPSNLFRYNTAASTYAFYATFHSCSSFNGIPVDTYRYNINVSTSGFALCHAGNIALTSLPADIFRYNTAVSSDGFYGTFSGCDLLATYGANLFKYNTLCSGNCFKETLANCPALQIRSDTFYGVGESGTRFHDQSPSFEYCFYRFEATGSQGTAPDLWNCDFGTGSPYTFYCFYGDGNNFDSLDNYYDIPDEWKFEPE